MLIYIVFLYPRPVIKSNVVREHICNILKIYYLQFSFLVTAIRKNNFINSWYSVYCDNYHTFLYH